MPKNIVAHPAEPASLGLHGMRRREFLLLGSSALAGLVATALHGQLVRSTSDAPISLLSVGYLNYVPQGSSPFPGRPGIVAAESLSSGDPRFAGSGALVKLVGFWRPASSRTPLGATLLTYYPATAEHERVPFVTWTYRSDISGVLATPHAMAQVPIDGDGLALALITSTPAPIVPKEFRPTLLPVVSGKVSEVLPSWSDLTSRGAAITLGTGSSGLKLRAGTYFIALLPASGRKIDWSAVRVADLRKPASLDPRGEGPLSFASATGSRPVDFAYLALAIDASSRPSHRYGVERATPKTG